MSSKDSKDTECQVIFQPSGRRGKVRHGTTLIEASRQLGVDIETICGENKTCGKCKVKIEEGFSEAFGADSQMSHLSSVTAEERKVLDAELESGHRLACAAEIRGDLLVFVPEESRGGAQVIRKEATDRRITLDPAVKLYHADMPEPNLDDPTADLERLVAALETKHGLNGLSIDYSELVALPQVLRQAKWQVTASVWNDKEIQRVQPGRVQNHYGLAIDIGTTTLAGYLCNLSTKEIVAVHSLMNPQVAHGEDVMARITYVMTNPDGLETLHRLIVDAINSIAQKVADAGGIEPEDICELVIVGNTAMHHLFLRIDPSTVGMSPFPPVVHEPVDVKARDLGIEIHRSANVHALPIEAGFVGADNVGVLIAEEPYNKAEITLVIDIGTNGELVLGNRQKLISASCATGPALEGAHIKFGMRAAPGAIERITIDPETIEADFKVIGESGWYREHRRNIARGICGSGIIDGVAEMFAAGIVQRTGAFNKEMKHPRLRGSGSSIEFVIAWAHETALGKDITITVKDVRAVQLAKAALYAGAKILMGRLGVENIEKVVLAGAFGSYIDKERAMTIGMFPDCDPEKVVAVGNAAGDGARIALLNVAKRREAERVARNVEYVELTLEKDFEHEYVSAMHFPHMRDEFPLRDAAMGREQKTSP